MERGEAAAAAAVQAAKAADQAADRGLQGMMPSGQVSAGTAEMEIMPELSAQSS